LSLGEEDIDQVVLDVGGLHVEHDTRALPVALSRRWAEAGPARRAPCRRAAGPAGSRAGRSTSGPATRSPAPPSRPRGSARAQRPALRRARQPDAGPDDVRRWAATPGPSP